jgi:hypothetical protein
MKKWLTAGLLAGGLAMTTSGWAQMMPGAEPAAPGAYANPADTTYATYQTTGWDPSLIAYAAGGLGLAGLGLKGFLRKGARES